MCLMHLQLMHAISNGHVIIPRIIREVRAEDEEERNFHMLHCLHSVVSAVYDARNSHFSTQRSWLLQGEDRWLYSRGIC